MWTLIIIVAGSLNYGSHSVAITSVDGFADRASCLDAAWVVRSTTDVSIYMRMSCVPKQRGAK